MITPITEWDTIPGVCAFCGDELSGRKRRFCTTDCRNWYYRAFHWGTAVSWALQRARHRCERCGITAKGLRAIYNTMYEHRFAPDYRFHLEVHHTVPLNGEGRTWHRLNAPEYLVVCCHDCHLEEHAKMRKREKREGEIPAAAPGSFFPEEEWRGLIPRT